MNAKFANSLLLGRKAVLIALSIAAMGVTAYADPVNVVNGNFEQTLTPNSSEFGGAYSSQQVTGWTTSGYNFVFTPGTASTTGATGQYGNVQLWGPGNGSNNGLTSSPAGGNFLALDGAYDVGAVSQTLSGLTVGEATTVSFYYAGAQQYGFNGATTEQLEVSLGGESLYTPVLDDPSHGFTGWQYETLTFTPTSTSEVLSFLAIGTPSGVPPMTLLDGVSVATSSPVPEPASLALLGTGLAGISGLVRSRFKRSR